MIFSYRLLYDAGNWVAECLDVDAEGEGRTQIEAIESLRRALAEHMYRPDAVAPPERGSQPPIDLVRVV
jgi:hypothetical protein